MLPHGTYRYTLRFRVNQVEHLKTGIGCRHTKSGAKPEEFLSTDHRADLTEKDLLRDVDRLSPC